MSRFFKIVALAATLGTAATSAQSAPVAMFGQYHESNGLIVNIPQNPPAVPCTLPPLLVAPPSHTTPMGSVQQHVALRASGPNDALCHLRDQWLNLTIPLGGATTAMGNKGLRIVKPQRPNSGGIVADGGLNVGDAFTVPPFAFYQKRGSQIGVVPESVTRQLDTTFTAVMPGINRQGPDPGPLPAGSYTIKTPGQMAAIPALTRRFSQMNWNNAGNGQNNDQPGGALVQRAAANTTFNFTTVGNNERVRVRYKAGPREFGGTMALLLDGKGKLWLGGPQLSGAFPTFLLPVAGTQPVGDGDPGFRVRNGKGWNATAPGFQAPGKIKAYRGNNITPMGLPRVAPDCDFSVEPPTPAGCQLFHGFDTYMTTMGGGGTVKILNKATSFKHQFAFTTGTASIVATASRRGARNTITLTGMGYDTVGVSAMGGVQRNVGLVAGSFSDRISDVSREINPQMLGVSIRMTPEPASTAALISGLGVLAALAYRRRS
jgi:hypothetical protein